MLKAKTKAIPHHSVTLHVSKIAHPEEDIVWAGTGIKLSDGQMLYGFRRDEHYIVKVPGTG